MAVEHKLPIGLHFNITEGKPISPPCILPTLLQPQTGEFRGKFEVKECLKRGEINLEEITIELEAQIKKFEELVGKKPTHIDGFFFFFFFFHVMIFLK